MKRILTTLAAATAILMLLIMVLPVYAANGMAPTGGCQPGADNNINGSWQLLSLEEYAQLLYEVGKAPDLASALERATTTYAFCDKNGDNYSCVMEQHLPNDANGSNLWFLIEDNHFPFGGQ